MCNCKQILKLTCGRSLRTRTAGVWTHNLWIQNRPLYHWAITPLRNSVILVGGKNLKLDTFYLLNWPFAEKMTFSFEGCMQHFFKPFCLSLHYNINWTVWKEAVLIRTHSLSAVYSVHQKLAIMRPAFFLYSKVLVILSGSLRLKHIIKYLR